MVYTGGMEKLFHLKALETTPSREVACGFITFLTMSYILFLNPEIVSQTGMPKGGVFAATALASALCCLLMGFVANAPLAMAPGLGLNTFITYVVCLQRGLAWQEGLAIVFLAGCGHMLLVNLPTRRALLAAIPWHLQIAFGVGMGLFIAYVGLKNAGLVTFFAPIGQSSVQGGLVTLSSAAAQGLTGHLGAPQLVSAIGLAVMLFLMALERKTGESYAAFPMGIVSAALVGVPLGVTDLSGVTFLDLSSLGDLPQVSLACLGSPGLGSLADDMAKLGVAAVLALTIMLMNFTDSVGTILGLAKVNGPKEETLLGGGPSRVERALMANSVGGVAAGLLGTTTITTYLESITGLAAGGRTGLTAITAGLLFLVCLPLAGFFAIIPPAATAPAIFVAGSLLIGLVRHIDWGDFEQSFPAFATIIGIPLFSDIIYGMTLGFLSHLVIQVAMGKARAVPPALWLLTLLLVATLASMARLG